MSILQTFDTQMMAARKALIAKDPAGEHAAFFAHVLSVAQNFAKQDQRLVEDGDIERALRTERNQLNLSLNGDAAKNIPPASGAWRDQVQGKLSVIESILPPELTEDKLGPEIRAAAAEADVTVELRNVKAITEALKKKFPGQIDTGKVAQLIKAGV